MKISRATEPRVIVWRRLDEARTIKARVDAGTAFEWEKRRLESLVREARTYSRLARTRPPPPPPPFEIARSESFRIALARAEGKNPDRPRLTPGSILNLHHK